MIGNRYGKLVVTEQRPSTDQGRMWLCKCDCGREIILPAKQLKLRTSCGKCKRLNPSGKFPKGIDRHAIKIQSNNTSGFKGVSEYRTRTANQLRYEAKLEVNGVKHRKRGFKTLDEAVAYRQELERKYLDDKR